MKNPSKLYSFTAEGLRHLPNGNIVALSTGLYHLDEPLLKVFRYDKLNRIKRMQTATLSGSNWGTLTNNYATAYTYDFNGNITSLHRNTETAQSLHNIGYQYNNANNRLNSITATGINSSTYTYDPIGNLTADAGESLQISWNVAGKVKQIITPTDIIRYTYNPAGQRQSKQIIHAQFSIFNYYLLDATGNVMCIYTRHGDTLTAAERPLYGSKRLGELRQQIKIGVNGLLLNYNTATIGFRHYELTDHLGNVMAVVSDRKTLSPDSVYYPVVISATDYYPFGYPIADRSSALGGYRYGFNGKENDNEIYGDDAIQNYGFRMYDTRIARFWGIDPITKDYPNLSPFQFASNTPIWAIDIDGMEAWLVTRNWDVSDMENFALFANTQIKVYEENKIKDDCANFAFRLIIDYAYKNQLPLKLKSSSGKVYNSTSPTYNNYDQYLRTILNSLNAKDIPANVYEVPKNETQAGDMEILKYNRSRGENVNFLHVVIFESVNPLSIVMGNLPPQELTRYHFNWPRMKVKDESQNKWTILSGENNVRWIILKIETPIEQSNEDVQDINK